MTAAVLPSPSPAERLAGLIDLLCKAVAAHGVRGLLTAPLLLMLWSRLSRMAVRARRLAARMAAGAPLSTPRRPAAPRAPPSRPYVRLPRGVTWLVRAVPGTAFGAAALQFLLDDPDMAEMAQLPPMRRLLNPLCRMLGVQPPPIAKQPPPPEPAVIARASDPPPPRAPSRQPDPPSPAPPASPRNAA